MTPGLPSEPLDPPAAFGSEAEAVGAAQQIANRERRPIEIWRAAPGLTESGPYQTIEPEEE